ncbi:MULTISPECIES: recombinase family protein [Lysinibacillus]|uniref:recombinase family protein n=1 Tax=Lysinibacillus TaxID=400634 RepID=UPI00214A8D3B|nr:MULTISPECIES: recombinase family protein [Lysinibacillus]UUV23430.1 recombinase family protein [Lysinibacillus sp. FN11]UYB46300.1 recombinase family protein [Lysinibacillus capsici]
MTQNKQDIRAVAYTRVSTKKEGQDKSYEGQKRYYKSFCKQQGYNYIDTYADKGSGTNATRKEFLKMLKDAGIDAKKLDGSKDYDYTISKTRKPLFDLIVCKDTSRFARNASEGMTLVKRLRKIGVHIFFEGLDLSTDVADNDNQINQWFLNGENESRATSRRIKNAFKFIKEENEYPTGMFPYGLYKDETGKLCVDEDKKKVVNEVFELAKTMGCRRIANILNEKGYPTTTGTKWGYSQVNTMLKNTLYYGTAMSGKTEVKALTENPSPVPVEQQTKMVDILKEPIISKEEFEKVQLILADRSSNKNGTKRGQNVAKKKDIFSKKIKCARCGGAYTRAVRRYKHQNGEVVEFYYYYCLTRNRANACDNSRHVPFNTLKKAISMIEPKLLFGDKGMGASIIKTIEQVKREHAKIASDYQTKISDNMVLIAEKSQVLTKLKIDSVIEMVESEINELMEQNHELQQKINSLKLSNLDRLVQTVGEREAEILSLSESITEEDKLRMISEIRIDGYKYTFFFDVPNFNDIINELNSFVSTTLEADTVLEDILNEFRVVEQNKKLVVAY